MMVQEEVSSAKHAMPMPMPLLVAAELQDHLMAASNDLERLQRLLSEAGDSLMLHFHAANGELQGLLAHLSTQLTAHPELHTPAIDKALQHMAGAITALQFQDMATQLVVHTMQRLRSCADRLASDTMGDDEDGQALVTAAPLRPNPVTQDEMDAGSVELF